MKVKTPEAVSLEFAFESVTYRKSLYFVTTHSKNNHSININIQPSYEQRKGALFERIFNALSLYEKKKFRSIPLCT